MKINPAQAWAFGRHVLTFSAGIVTALAATHVVTPDQANSATNSINQIGSGISDLVKGVAGLVAFGSAVYAALRASLRNQIAAVQAHPQAQVTVTDPALAKGIPGVKIAK